MKYFSICIAMLLTLSTAAVAQNTGDNKEVIYKENKTAELGQFDSYYFGNSFMNLEDQEWYTYSTLNSKMVQNAIVHEFDTYGYDLKAENPDILVNYMIFDSKYNDKYGYYKNPYTVEQGNGMEENILSQLQDGSLVVSLIDADNGKPLWVGYIPEAVEPDDNLREQQIDIRASVSEVLEAYMASANFDETTY